MLCNFVFITIPSLAVGADARVHVLEALELELWLVLIGSGLLHLDVFNCLLVRLCLLGLCEYLALLLLYMHKIYISYGFLPVHGRESTSQ